MEEESDVIYYEPQSVKVAFFRMFSQVPIFKEGYTEEFRKENGIVLQKWYERLKLPKFPVPNFMLPKKNLVPLSRPNPIKQPIETNIQPRIIIYEAEETDEK